MKGLRIVKAAAGAAAIGAASWGGFSAVTWARYGHPDLARRPRDDLLDRFMPDPEVDEYHHVEADAPASITFDVGTRMDLWASPLIRAIFRARMLPSLLKGEHPAPRAARGILEETLAIGFGLLAEEPGSEVVIGTYTQPWHGDVEFHPLPPEEFAAFAQPGYVKIVVAFGAEPLAEGRSRFVTRTRVVTTDAESRRKFRLYWAPMSAGIILIRYTSLPMVKRDAERLAREAVLRRASAA